MKKFLTGITVFYFQIIPLVSLAQGAWTGYEKLFQPARSYVINQTYNDMTIDGKAVEPSWDQASWTDEFVDIEGIQMHQPKYRTRAKMLWDKNNLYILAELEEPHIWAYYKQQDFKKANGDFASALSDLKIAPVIDVSPGNSARLKLTTTGSRFTVLLTTKEGLILSVNEDGLLQNVHPKN